MRTVVKHYESDKAINLLTRALIGAALFLGMLVIGVQVARSDGASGSPATTPSTTAYHFSSHPMISGTVVTVNDHQMVVNTDQGEHVALEIDTRTMAPRDLAPGMVMRAEFVALEDCRFYAQRITPIRRGMSTNRLQAYAVPAESRVPMAYGASDFGGHGVESIMTQTGADPPQALGEHSLGMAMMATPTTADYQFSTRPKISGSVVSVNDHRMVVKTDQGQMVALVMDSRTMVPREVAHGSVVRAEFTQLQDGRYYAKQISRIGGGVATREQAYAHTHDSDFLIAQNPPDCGVVNAAPGSTMTSAVERREAVTSTAPIMMQSVAQPEPETLPQTGSNQPLLLLLGFSALGSAGLVMVARGRQPEGDKR
jgi:LPXTG-motif cell wall-anchored protein